jgi:hypothetical protein
VVFAIAAVPFGPFVAVLMAPGTSAGDTAVAVAMAGGAEKAGKSAEASAEVLAIVDGAAGAARALERDIDGFLQKIAVAQNPSSPPLDVNGKHWLRRAHGLSKKSPMRPGGRFCWLLAGGPDEAARRESSV